MNNPTDSTKVRNALSGHVSEETAFVVDSYPYGSLRCTIKFWLEHAPKKGYRLVTRTQNPKNGVWNAPKKSTYSPIAAMYTDEKGHVQWVGLTGQENPEVIEAFIRDFPGQCAPLLKALLKAGIHYYENKSLNKIVWTINGVAKPWTEAELAEAAATAEAYSKVLALLG